MIVRTLDNLQIDRNIVKNICMENVYIALETIEKYNFSKELSNDEKKSLFLSIINCSKLEKGKNNYLTNFMRIMEKAGFSIQEIFGMVINLGVNGKMTKEGGLSYSVIISSTKKACNRIIENGYKVQVEVTEETIQKAVKKANKPKKVKGQDIAKATMELTTKGSGGSQICDDVQAEYMRLLDERTNNNQKEGSEQGESN